MGVLEEPPQAVAVSPTTTVMTKSSFNIGLWTLTPGKVEIGFPEIHQILLFYGDSIIKLKATELDR